MPNRLCLVARRAALPLGLLALLFVSACTSIPAGRSSIDDVTVRGGSKVSASDIETRLQTSATPRFFGLVRGVVYDYEIFDEQTFQHDLARVERTYRARGFFDAHARAGRIWRVDEKHVRVEILVDEGAPTLNREPRILGATELPKPVVEAISKVVAGALPPGEPFNEETFRTIDAAVAKVLTDRGYAFATVTRDVYVDVGARRASLVLDVTPGPLATFGAVTIADAEPQKKGVSGGTIDASPVRTAINIEPGAPYTTRRIDDAVTALLDLGVFASVDVVPDLSHPDTRVVPVTVRVQPAKLRQFRVGFGVELDEIKTELRGTVAWEHHNFLGGLRSFSVDATPGVVLYPTRIDHLVGPKEYLLEERLRLQLKQPGFIEAHTTGFVRPEFNIFPLLVQTRPPPGIPVVGFRELRGAVGVERRFLTKLLASFSYEVQVENPFSYVGPLDPGMRTLAIAYPDLRLELDLRDDRIHPHSGVFLANDLQVAGGIFGGDAADVRVQPEARAYLPLARGITFATRASVGLLFARNYGDIVANHLLDPVTPENLADRVRDIELVFFRGFFSGGPTSNRGFPIRGIAPHGVVPFVTPGTAAQQTATSCTPSQANNYTPDPNVCSISIGGFSLWELSSEFRFVLSGPASAAVFCDMGDVSPRPHNLRLDHPHLSCGVGARYDTPVGPIRLDVGYRIQPLQVLGFKSEAAAYAADRGEGLQPTIFGLPIAFAVGIGEAY